MADEIKKPGVTASTEQADAVSAKLVQRETLTPEEQGALDAYRSTRLVWDANNFLRGRESLVTKATSTVMGNEDMVKQVKHLDSAIKKSRLTEDATFVRGLALDKDPQEIFQPGGKFTDLGFISTSMAQPVAEKFSTTFTKHPVIMEVAMPRGASAHRMERKEGAYDESEFLLGRNSEFRVDSLAKREDGKTVVRLQYLDAEPTPIKPKPRLLPTAADAWQHFEQGGEVAPSPTFNRFPAPGGSEPKMLKGGGSVPPSPGIPIDADEVPARLQSGEFVMPRGPAGKYKRELEQMRAETVPSSASEPMASPMPVRDSGATFMPSPKRDVPHFSDGGSVPAKSKVGQSTVEPKHFAGGGHVVAPIASKAPKITSDDYLEASWRSEDAEAIHASYAQKAKKAKDAEQYRAHLAEVERWQAIRKSMMQASFDARNINPNGQGMPELPTSFPQQPKADPQRSTPVMTLAVAEGLKKMLPSIYDRPKSSGSEFMKMGLPVGSPNIPNAWAGGSANPTGGTTKDTKSIDELADATRDLAEQFRELIREMRQAKATTPGPQADGSFVPLGPPGRSQGGHGTAQTVVQRRTMPSVAEGGNPHAMTALTVARSNGS